MKTRPFGKRAGLAVAPVSIGAMRLPADMDAAVALIRRAIDAGMRYIDTSRGYGDSEQKLALALKDGYREKVILSTKWSPWITKYDDSDDASADCVRRRLEESMRRLDVDALDFYQVWNIMSRETYDAATAPGAMLDAILRARDEGLVRHLGFTSHDTPENLLSYLPRIGWCDIVLFTYNLLNTRYAEVLQAYHEAGIGTVVMNPIGGGKLREASAVLVQLAERVGAVSVPDLALRFILSNPHVDTAIMGITNSADVDDSVASVNRGPFTPNQMGEITTFLDDISARQGEFCTSCGYCAPCREGIDIPKLMGVLFEDRFWGFREAAAASYAALPGPKAEACIQCGDCVEKCTQHLRVMDEIGECRRLFSVPAVPNTP